MSYSTDVRTIATATGRLGVAFDRVLVYAKGGWAGAHVDISGLNTVLPDNFSVGDWRNGCTVGGGAELKLSPSMGLGVEYSYMDLGSRSYAGITAAALPFTITDHDLQVQSVTARLNFKIQRDEYVPLK